MTAQLWLAEACRRLSNTCTVQVTGLRIHNYSFNWVSIMIMTAYFVSCLTYSHDTHSVNRVIEKVSATTGCQSATLHCDRDWIILIQCSSCLEYECQCMFCFWLHMLLIALSKNVRYLGVLLLLLMLLFDYVTLVLNLCFNIHHKPCCFLEHW